jgi:hypothetical protein
MIIGLSGRINISWPGKVFTSDNQELEINVDSAHKYNTFELSADPYNSAAHETNQCCFVYPVLIPEKIPPSEDVSPFHKSPKSQLFRGPPVLS